MNKLSLLISTSIIILKKAECHISLSYPKARKYDLDFLDNFRTPGDCGMYPGEDRTVLEAGSLVNITWSLAYPHGGGYKLELVHHDNYTVLIPGDEWEGGVSHQHRLITVPNTPCTSCYIRIQTQAREWGEGYVFRSCADITIVSRDHYQPSCGEHGDDSDHGDNGDDGDVCKCDRLYHGDKCQYLSGCNNDQDCNGPKGQGQCLQLDSTVFPDR